MKSALLLPCILLTGTASAVEAVSNFSFESGQAPWSSFNSSGNAAFDYNAAGDVDPLDADPKAVRVTARRKSSDTVRQNIIAFLPSSPDPAGEPFRARLKIKTGGFAFVRCQLQFQNNTGVPATTQTATSIILAEGIVRDAGQWIVLDGTRKIVWPSFTPNRAWLSIEVGQLYKESLPQGPGQQPIVLPTPTDKWPDFTLDWLSLERDGDLDGLSDSYEQSLNPPGDTSKADTDGDGLPDGWEDQFGFPLTGSDDSGGDPDADGFTNLEEYWAATIPKGTGGADSYPGKTANSNATPAAKQLARWLALLPSQSRRLIGHSVTTLPGDYDTYVTGLASLVQQQAPDGMARWPAMLSVPAEGITSPVDIVNSMSFATPYAQAGGIIVVKWAMWNPWTGGNMGSQGAAGQVDVLGLADPASATYNLGANAAARAVMNGWLDQIAAELARFLDPAFGGHPDNVVLFRPVSEMNGNWFWWGHRTIEEYQALWKYLFDYLTVTKGLNHLLWVYESAQSEHSFTATIANPSACDYHYPGDGFVDVMGHNMYDDADWVLPHDLNRLYRRYPKIYGFPQAGCAQVGGSTIDNLVALSQMKTSFPRASFYIPWNSFPGSNGQQVNNAIISNGHAVELMTDPGIITRESAQWMSGWQQWAHDLLGTLAAPPNGDADGDGRANAIEFATGGDPLLNSPAEARPAVSFPTGLPPQFHFHRDLLASGLTLAIEGSDDLASWQTLAAADDGNAWSVLSGTLIQGMPNSGIAAVSFEDNPLSLLQGRRFYRLRADVR